MMKDFSVSYRFRREHIDVVTTASSGFGEARYENVTVAIGQNTQLSITVNPGSNVDDG